MDVLDLSLELPPDSFCYRSPYPDEHLNEKGRREVASHISDRIFKKRHASGKDST